MKLKVLWLAVFLNGFSFLAPQSSAFSLSDLAFDVLGNLTMEIPVDATHYYVLFRVDLETGMKTAVSASLVPSGATSIVLSDPTSAGLEKAFYQAKRILLSAPEDVDGDGIDDLYELQHPLLLNAIDATDATEDADEDGESNLDEYLATTDPAEVISVDVTFETSDGITLKGTHRRPAARPGTKLPAVVLIHQGGSSRVEWNPYLSAFTTAGYATLAYDIRGHGLSGGTFSGADYDDPNTIPKGLVAALAFIRAQANTETTRVGVVGASVGGNLACVASQKSWIKTGVNISGKTSAVKNLAAETNLALTSMFHISSSDDGGGSRATWANELHGLTAAPRQVEIVPGSSAHGVSVIAADPTLLDRIITWLDTTL